MAQTSRHRPTHVLLTEGATSEVAFWVVNRSRGALFSPHVAFAAAGAFRPIFLRDLQSAPNSRGLEQPVATLSAFLSVGFLQKAAKTHVDAQGRNHCRYDIQAQIRKSGGDYGAWSVGTAKDSHGTRFTRHEAADLHDGWIYREAFTPGVARDVREYFVTQCGADAAASGEDEAGRIVYAYKKTSQANQTSPAPARPIASRRWAA